MSDTPSERVEQAREALVQGVISSLVQEYGDAPRHPSTQRRYDRDYHAWVEDIDALVAAVRAEERARLVGQVEALRNGEVTFAQVLALLTDREGA